MTQDHRREVRALLEAYGYRVFTLNLDRHAHRTRARRYVQSHKAFMLVMGGGPAGVWYVDQHGWVSVRSSDRADASHDTHLGHIKRVLPKLWEED